MTQSEVIAVCLALRNLRKFCESEQSEVDQMITTTRDKKGKLSRESIEFIESWTGQSMAFDDVISRIDSTILETLDDIDDS